MSRQKPSPSRSCSTDLFVKILPRITLDGLGKTSSNLDILSTEAPSPLLPAGKRPLLEISRSIKKSNFAITPFDIDDTDIEGELDSNNQYYEPNTPLMPREIFSPLDLGCVSFGEESPLPCTRMSGLKSPSFSESFYTRIEDYLDSQNLYISQPEVNKRKLFSNLRVSTLNTRHKSENNQDDFNSPSFLSPSIHTSSLFVRRSSSKDSNIESAKIRPRVAISKSPFYSCAKNDRIIELESERRSDCLEIDEFEMNEVFSSASKKRKMSGSASKVRGLVWNDDSEISSASSIKLIDCSPTILHAQ